MSERQLAKKLANIMQDVKYIQKRGHNKFHNYKYATEADVNEKVRESLAERNIIMLPSMKNHTMRETKTAKGDIEYIVCVDMEFRFIDGDTGEELTVTMSGEGQDRGDKAIYKAISGAQKYALMKVFMIPTGDDPESDESVDERNHGKPEQTSKPAPNNVNDTANQIQGAASQAQLKVVQGAIAKKDLSETEISVVLHKFGVTKLTELKSSDIGNVVKEIMSMKVAN